MAYSELATQIIYDFFPFYHSLLTWKIIKLGYQQNDVIVIFKNNAAMKILPNYPCYRISK